LSSLERDESTENALISRNVAMSSREGDSPETIHGSTMSPLLNKPFEWPGFIPFSKVSLKSTGILPRQFSTPLDERASCYFMANFVLIPHEDTTKGYLEFLVPLLKQSQESHLILSFMAVALAA